MSLINLKEWPRRYILRPWQIEFAQKYIQSNKSRSLLVAAPGMGGTISALYAARLMREKNITNSLIILNDHVALKKHWIQVAGEIGFILSDTVDQYRETDHDGLSITIQSLNSNKRILRLLDLAEHSNCFGIADEIHRSNKTNNEIIDKILLANNNNRFLFITGSAASAQDSFDAQFYFNTEYIFQDSIIKLLKTKNEIAHFAPSFSTLQKLIHKNIQIDDMSWREFETLISQLLMQDGYEVELMRGTKDGGVDVVAVKDMGEAGFFKTVWQAKKNYSKNKVGLSVIRELADTRNEFKASKGIIVTSTYLTRDALARVQRDKYILGKVDRDDLNKWIQKTLFSSDN